MSTAERKLAAWLLREAASQFANHGCNDMPDEAFDGIAPSEHAELLREFNHWNHSTDDPVRHPGDSSWMNFLSNRILSRATR